MGQQNSQLIDSDTPPETLSDRSLAAVAQLIKDGRAKRIVVLTGAGISTAAGIPDFRSPGTGLYNNLARLNLPHPEAVFDIDFFEKNPYPFYLLAKELYPGNFHPTISHAFVALLARKNLLRMLFTQNIDCLERAAGVPADLIVEAHGSFATQRCVDCRTPYPGEAMREHVARGEPARCGAEGCAGTVKPDIVFFGEQLPAAFFDHRSVPAAADLMLVLGTSLSVQPFASLPTMAAAGVPRVLFNLQRVGDLGTRPDDVLHLGDCDSGVRRLADELGWREELERAWEEIVGQEEAQRQRDRDASGPTKRNGASHGVDEIAAGVEDKLKLGSPPPPSPSPSPPPPTPPSGQRDREAAQDNNDDNNRTTELTDQRAQGQVNSREKEEQEVGGEDHDGDGLETHAPGAPARSPASPASGPREAGAPTGGGGGVGGGPEAEEQRDEAKGAQATASAPAPAPGRVVHFDIPSSSSSSSSKEDGTTVQPQQPAAAAAAVSPRLGLYDEAAQPVETLPSIQDPPREKKKKDGNGGDVDGAVKLGL